MRNRTILEELADLSVNVNGLIVPGRSIERALARHAVSLVALNDHETYRVSLIGSATAVRFKSRYLIICTGHQLEGFDPKQVAMLKDDGSYVVTSAGYVAPVVREDTDAHDLAVFDFTEPVAAHADFKGRFFNLNDVPPDTRNDHILAMLLTGYPSSKQRYEIEEANHIGLARLKVLCLPDGQPQDPSLMQLRPTSPLEIDPDGMSGGPAFVVQLVHGEPRAYFAGIIVRGGKERFYVLKPGTVMMFLEWMFPR